MDEKTGEKIESLAKMLGFAGGRELMSLLGISEEEYRRMPEIEVIRRICTHTGVSSEYFLGETKKPFDTYEVSESTKKLLADFASLGEEQQEIVRNTLRTLK